MFDSFLSQGLVTRALFGGMMNLEYLLDRLAHWKEAAHGYSPKPIRHHVIAFASYPQRYVSLATAARYRPVQHGQGDGAFRGLCGPAYNLATPVQRLAVVLHDDRALHHPVPIGR